jgi:hypothetical protein
MEFCTGVDELRDSDPLPAALSAFRNTQYLITLWEEGV